MDSPRRAPGFSGALLGGKSATEQGHLGCLQLGCTSCEPQSRPQFRQSAQVRAARREFLNAQQAFDVEEKAARREGREPDPSIGDKYFKAYEVFDALSGKESFMGNSRASGFQGHSS